jgi:zinc protease
VPPLKTLGDPLSGVPSDAALLRSRLDNGLSVVLAEHDAADVVAVQLWFGVGAVHETDGEAGLSHFLEHLLFKGTPTRGPGVVDQTISGLGGEINAATSHDFTYFHLVVPAAHMDTALDLMADVARHASLDSDEIDRERLVVLEEIRRAQDSPGGQLWRFTARQRFPDHPYGRPVLGTPAVIRTVDRARIAAYRDRHYVPNRATLVVVGHLEAESAIDRVRRAFAEWQPGPAAAPPVPPPEPPAALVRAEEVRPVRQVYQAVSWGVPTVPDEDAYVLDVLAAVLGRGRASRLNQALKERLGLVSTIGAAYYPQRDAGTLQVTARTTQAQRRDVEPALLDEIERIRRTGVSEAELARAITRIEAAHAFEHETAEGAAYAYGVADSVWTLDFELGYLDRIRGVTRERVRETAARYLVPDRFIATALTPPDSRP